MINQSAPTPDGPDSSVRWTSRVTVDRGSGIAYTPGQIVVPTTQLASAEATLGELGLTVTDTQRALGFTVTDTRNTLGFGVLSVAVTANMVAVAGALRAQGIAAQPNHVFFANSGFRASPAYASPAYASPAYASPAYASPAYASPAYASGGALSAVEADYYRRTGRRPSTARPIASDVAPKRHGRRAGTATCKIVVLDTGLPALERHRPGPLPKGDHVETPDQDSSGMLDPAAGHGLFIGGIIEQIAPGCDLAVHHVLSTFGDGNELTIAAALGALAGTGVDVVVLAFSGYVMDEAAVLSGAITKLQVEGTIIVAAAGNDATDRPTWPAVLPGVIGVAALAPYGPAAFTNYGPWVRACAPGVDLVSSFYKEFNGRAGVDASGTDIDKFDGLALWSGTSFAAPVVAAGLARLIQMGFSRAQAVDRLIDDPNLFRLPGLGTVVNLA